VTQKQRYLRWAPISLVGLVILYLGTALILINLPMPQVAQKDWVSREQAIAEGMTLDQSYESQPFEFPTRDGLNLHGARYASKSPHTILFLHGASGHSSQLNNGIGLIRKATGVEIFTYDHRGHGSSPGARGDLDHVDQYVEDVADVLKTIKKLKPEGRIILAAHSMGGGIVQRYAVSDAAKLADAYLLFAPALGRGLPGEVLPPNVKVHMPRILGLFMLNAIGVKRFNHLPAINFGFPEFNGHINQYTFNAALSMRPDTFEKGIAALQKPCTGDPRCQRYNLRSHRRHGGCGYPGTFGCRGCRDPGAGAPRAKQPRCRCQSRRLAAQIFGTKLKPADPRDRSLEVVIADQRDGPQFSSRFTP